MGARLWQRKKSGRRRRNEEDLPAKVRPGRVTPGQHLALAALQRHLGNQAVQRLLLQRQAADKEEVAQTAAEPVEIGPVKIEKPEIKRYEVSGESFDQVTGQILAPAQWYEYAYEINPTVENGRVSQVAVTVRLIIHLPQWVGPGWDRASAADKAQWLVLLKIFGADEATTETVNQLPRSWLGQDWDQAPEALKSEWLQLLTGRQAQEKSPLDVASRRALVLQQRLLNRPESQTNAITAQFLDDVAAEEAVYHQLRAAGQIQSLTLDPAVLVH
jgi:hypothetical protein